MRRSTAWLVLLVVTTTLTAMTTSEALRRYRAFETGWSWDLAYYNQWLWAITQGDGILSVRPMAAYADEGPPVWKMNYLAPIRLLLIPIYAGFPDPRTLLVIQAVVFWWIVPASYMLVRSETKSDGLALIAALLVPATPLLWPLAWNDFRELQLAAPFILWAIQGYRSRSLKLAALGVGGMLACRQEFALVVATLGLIPPREREDIGRTYIWAQCSLILGLGWILFGFLGYLKWVVGGGSHRAFLAQFGGEKASIAQTLETAADLLWYGLGPWVILALLAPRVALLALPWIWSIANGRWALRLLETTEWHHVRYAAPIVPLVIGAGLLGYCRLATWLLARRNGRIALALVLVAASAGFYQANRVVLARLEKAPKPIEPAEASAIWSWIERVGPEDWVVAAYEVTAPLSSRRHLYSYVLDRNKPRGYPILGPEFRWVFVEHQRIDPKILTEQGFQQVHEGPFLRIFRRD